MKIGKLNRLMTIQSRSATQDAAGQQIDTWTDVGTLWVNALHQTGAGAIRSRVQTNVSTQLALYSFKCRYASALLLGINNGMRGVLNSLYFDIKDLTLDLENQDEAFLVCEQGGSTG